MKKKHLLLALALFPLTVCGQSYYYQYQDPNTGVTTTFYGIESQNPNNREDIEAMRRHRKSEIESLQREYINDTNSGYKSDLKGYLNEEFYIDVKEEGGATQQPERTKRQRRNATTQFSPLKEQGQMPYAGEKEFWSPAQKREIELMKRDYRNETNPGYRKDIKEYLMLEYGIEIN
ncbi:MAG: hypothetical protein S4CHLAM2_01310 [Chlamydiales bacterium]|nr:hypothetical protein [Chlamydiales bacterium]